MLNFSFVEFDKLEHSSCQNVINLDGQLTRIIINL